jgi:aldose 1-epimerase
LKEVLKTMTVTPDQEITLMFGHQRAVVSPWGASLRRYFLIESGEEYDLVWGYSGAKNKKGGQGDVLIPFPGRIADGRYEFDGEQFQLERNDKEGPNAIHGFVRTMPWRVVASGTERALFEIALEAEQYRPRGYPFSLQIQVSYLLNAEGLSCSFEVKNSGTRVAPVGVGFHPYFTVGTERIDQSRIQIPAAGYLELNDRLVPTGRIMDAAGTEWDCRRLQPIGTRRFNHCYVRLERDPQGWVTTSLRPPGDGAGIEVKMDRAFSALVIYTGDAIPNAARCAAAIEPMTCASDAFNHPDWGLERLQPGHSFAGRYMIHHR